MFYSSWFPARVIDQGLTPPTAFEPSAPLTPPPPLSDLFSLQVSQQAAKCIPAMVCPELTEQIRREVAASLHQRKGDFTCYFLTDLVTFTLPAGQWWTSLTGTQHRARLTHGDWLSEHGRTLSV